MYRWSLYTGGPCVQVVLVYRWSLYTGGLCVQVVLVHRWSLYTGGPWIQVVFVHRWSLYTGGPCTQVVLVYRWSLYTGGPCVQVVLVHRFYYTHISCTDCANCCLIISVISHYSMISAHYSMISVISHYFFQYLMWAVSILAVSCIGIFFGLLFCVAGLCFCCCVCCVAQWKSKTTSSFGGLRAEPKKDRIKCLIWFFLSILVIIFML